MRSLCLAVLLYSAACNPGVPDITGDVSITQGVFGQATDSGTLVTKDASAVSGRVIELRQNQTVVGTTTSNKRGFFEIPAPAGAYTICLKVSASFDFCGDLTITTGTVHIDIEHGTEGYYWRLQ